jgi:hypothetical protein
METEGRGIEAGGLLLGRTQRDGGQTLVVIEDFEPLQCEHLAGPSFILSASDRRALEARLRRRKATGGSSLAGFYRSNTRQGYGATIEDVALMSAYFSESSNVFLLIQADRDAPLTAGFLIWEGGSIRSQKSRLEFPFSGADLVMHAHVAAPVHAVAPAPMPRASARSDLPAKATLAKFVNVRIMAGWLSAAAMLAGVMYNELRREPQVSTIERTAEHGVKPRLDQPVAPADAPHAAADTDAAAAKDAAATKDVAAESKPDPKEPPASAAVGLPPPPPEPPKPDTRQEKTAAVPHSAVRANGNARGGRASYRKRGRRTARNSRRSAQRRPPQGPPPPIR